ncbi:MAG: redoxin family protein [Parvularculaceae bacterium]
MIRPAACLAFAFALAATPAFADPAIDAVAPAFSAITSAGKTITLDQFKGAPVVLEWTNDGCPFVQKHYETGNMQKTQAAAQESGAIWITVISSAPGKQGHVNPAGADKLTADRGAHPDFVVLDESGAIGKAYAAKTTPHMFVIDEKGVLRYDGAIDDKPSANHATVNGASNFVLAAVNSVAKGEPVADKRTKPYGCSVKYGS